MNFVIKNLSDKEMGKINGGGLIEDIGYGSHFLYDKTCEAYNRVKKWVKSMF